MSNTGRFRVTIADRDFALGLAEGVEGTVVADSAGETSSAGRRWVVEHAGESRAVELLRAGADGAPSIVRVDGVIHRLSLDPKTGRGRSGRAVFDYQSESELAARVAGARRGKGKQATRVTSPLPGRIVHIAVKPGQQVKTGDPLLTIEAMKMENEVVAPASGTVAKLEVSAGQAVEGDALLVELEPPQPA